MNNNNNFHNMNNNNYIPPHVSNTTTTTTTTNNYVSLPYPPPAPFISQLPLTINNINNSNNNVIIPGPQSEESALFHAIISVMRMNPSPLSAREIMAAIKKNVPMFKDLTQKPINIVSSPFSFTLIIIFFSPSMLTFFF